MSGSLDTAMNILGYNTWLFQSAVKDVSEDRFAYRINDRTNAFDRLAGHVTVCRHAVASMLQLEVPELPWGTFGEFGFGMQFEPQRVCPPLPEVAAMFDAVTAVLMAELTSVPEDVLAEPSPFEIPGDGQTMRDLLAFMAMHETYHIGQMGILKKSMGGPGVMEG
ncbi:MAG: DinB family protein [Gemmatimonadales bacterium]